MAVPAYLNTAYRYYTWTESAGGAAEWLTKLTAELVTGPATADKWTESPAATFKSPVDAYGRFMKVVAATASTTRLTVTVSDMWGTTAFARTFDMDTGGNECWMSTGPCHIALVSQRASTTAECMYATFIEPAPDDISETLNGYLYGIGTRNTTGTAANMNQYECFRPNYTGGAYALGTGLCQQAAYGRDCISKDQLGNVIAWPVEFVTSGSPTRFAGRGYQMIGSDSDTFAFGDSGTFPIDTGTTATFRCIPRTATRKRIIMVRKA